MTNQQTTRNCDTKQQVLVMALQHLQFNQEGHQFCQEFSKRTLRRTSRSAQHSLSTMIEAQQERRRQTPFSPQSHDASDEWGYYVDATVDRW